MILDLLIIENVGVYAGRQEALLSPDPDKPVILFGGLNGGGKTTMLEAIQLVLHGARARIASRGALPYKEYLREAIHRGADISVGSSITIRFRRMVDGTPRHYELKRSWREGLKDIEEMVQVWCDGEVDDVLTEHWAEYIEGYLPSGIAHLFFFDGEQIKDLAEGQHAAEILGTAVHSLLGLDLVDRLEDDLKVLERRKKGESLSNDAARKLEEYQNELKILDQQQEQVSNELGALTNGAGQLAKEIHKLEERFRQDGGEIYEQRSKLAEEFAVINRRKEELESELRDLAAGVAPLLSLGIALEQLEERATHDNAIRKARVLIDSLTTRDEELLSAMFKSEMPNSQRRRLSEWLEKDLLQRTKTAKEVPFLSTTDQFALEVRHLRASVLPDISAKIREKKSALGKVEEMRARISSQLARVPSADSIAKLQKDLEHERSAHREQITKREQLHLRLEALQRQKMALEGQMDKVGAENIDNRFAIEDRHRVLRHSEKVRATLAKFRRSVIGRHTQRLERLILDSFTRLLRKEKLVTGLRIDPETFVVTLTGRDGKTLPFSRLSAGERQLLATSFLWGLAQASGRPIPTIIDTPLGRLDSSHRKHLVERYFPVASHQVILLSTDEEITDGYLAALKPFVTRSFHLAHDEALGTTSINRGYFPEYETAR